MTPPRKRLRLADRQWPPAKLPEAGDGTPTAASNIPGVLTIPAINYSNVDYQRIRVMVKLDSIRILDDTLRTVDRDNMLEIHEGVLQDGVDTTLGVPTVTFRRGDGGVNWMDYLEK